MDKDLLTSCLTSALTETGQIDWSDSIHLPDLDRLNDGNYPAVRRLIDSLHAQSDLIMFDRKIQIIANQAYIVQISQLATWLMRRASEVGPANAISDLQRYLDATEIPFSYIWALKGLKVDGTYDFGNGIMLFSWDEVPQSHDNEIIYRELLPLWLQPSAALIQSISMPKIYVDNDNYKQGAALDDMNLHDAMHCITAVGPFAPQILVSWLSAPDWAPRFGGIGFSMLSSTMGRARNNALTTSNAKDAIELLAIFKALDQKPKDILRLASERLNIAMRHYSLIDAAIDLGISLESLFLNDLGDDRGELKFRLRLRIARYLAQDSLQREDLFRLVGKLYNLRSKAVHTGRILPEKRKEDFKLLEQGYDLAAHAIRRFIKEGLPDWNSVQFS